MYFHVKIPTHKSAHTLNLEQETRTKHDYDGGEMDMSCIKLKVKL